MVKKRDENPTSRIEQVLAAYNKLSGEHSTVILLDENAPIEKIPVISTGILSVDKVCGVGGLPCGRIVEVFGPESTGKTTLLLHTIAECQRSGGIAAFVDVEHALDMKYASAIGVDVHKLLVSQPDSGEEALNTVDSLAKLLQTGDIIVVDSIAALVPKSELNGEMGDQHVGLQARLMSQALRKLTGVVSKSGVCLAFINQLRMKIGIAYGNPETTTGGNALKFYATIRLEVRGGETVKKGEEPIGRKLKIKAVKNKVAPPFRTAECELRFGQGIPKILNLVRAGIDSGILEKSGAWISYNGTNLGQGVESVAEYLSNSSELCSEILTRVGEAFRF